MYEYFVARFGIDWTWTTFRGRSLREDLEALAKAAPHHHKAIDAVLGVWQRRNPKAVAEIMGHTVYVAYPGSWRGGTPTVVWDTQPELPPFDRRQYLSGQHPHIAARTVGPRLVALEVGPARQEVKFCRYDDLDRHLEEDKDSLLVFFSDDWPTTEDRYGTPVRYFPS